ncbi:Hypothetical predicted protein, partial [Pelobates cultripes]
NLGLPAQERREACETKSETKPSSPVKRAPEAAVLTAQHPFGLGPTRSLLHAVHTPVGTRGMGRTCGPPSQPLRLGGFMETRQGPSLRPGAGK